jgi:hypothetical protein
MLVARSGLVWDEIGETVDLFREPSSPYFVRSQPGAAIEGPQRGGVEFRFNDFPDALFSPAVGFDELGERFALVECN